MDALTERDRDARHDCSFLLTTTYLTIAHILLAWATAFHPAKPMTAMRLTSQLQVTLLQLRTSQLQIASSLMFMGIM